MAARTLLIASSWIGLVSLFAACGSDTNGATPPGESSGGNQSDDFSRNAGSGSAGKSSKGGSSGASAGSKVAGSTDTAGAAGTGSGAGGASGKENGGGSSGSSHSGGSAGRGNSGGGGASSAGHSGDGGSKLTGGGGSAGGTNAGGNSAGAAGKPGSTGGASGGSGSGTAGAAGSGTAGSAGSAGGTPTDSCADTDQNNKGNWSPGDSTSDRQAYLRSCDVRLINNNWGAAQLNCSASANQYSIFVNKDGSFGWNFNRGDCDTKAANANPDFPEIEFGVHPFGKGNSLATSPDFSTTTLLPLQIKDIKSASVTIDNLTIQMQQSASWDITFELWLSERDPLKDSNPGVYAELMTFWGWQDGRYPEPPNGKGPTGNGAGDQVSAGSKSYKLEVQSDSWADGKWRYFQFRATDGPQKSFNGKVDVKPLLDYVVSKRGYSADLWVSRFEVGSEIDDLTQGSVTVQSITFEVNGESRSAGKK